MEGWINTYLKEQIHSLSLMGVGYNKDASQSKARMQYVSTKLDIPNLKSEINQKKLLEKSGMYFRDEKGFLRWKQRDKTGKFISM